MARVGYIMAVSHYEYLEEDRKWMEEFGCINILEEMDENESSRPLWKQLLSTIERGDTLVVSKLSNAIRGSRELAIFLEFCRVQDIRIISIHDKIDSRDEVFPRLQTDTLFNIIGSLPHEALILRKSTRHHLKLKEKITCPLPPVSAKTRKMERELNVINMYVAGHSIDDIWRLSGYSSRSSIFRILNKHNIKLNRGHHSGPIKRKK